MIQTRFSINSCISYLPCGTTQYILPDIGSTPIWKYGPLLSLKKVYYKVLQEMAEPTDPDISREGDKSVFTPKAKSVSTDQSAHKKHLEVSWKR